MLRGMSVQAKVGAIACAVVLLECLAATSALAAPAPGLPRTYTVQRVDSPLPTPGGRIGAGLINMGDANGDGEDDFVTLQVQGTPGSNGAVYIISGETGQLIRTANMPDAGNTVVGSLDAGAIVDPNVDVAPDLGSCAGGTAGATCALGTIGAPDGVNDILVGAQGVDVGGQRDVGRAYVFDGATLAVLKRIDMPAADRALQTARIAENPPERQMRAGGFGRTVQSPRGLPPCVNNAGVGDCPDQPAGPTFPFPGVSAASKIGDMDGGGRAEIVVGANRFHENAASAFPGSQCNLSGAALCYEAGRAYIYRGEDVAGSDPAVNLDTPLVTVRNPVAQGPDVGIAGQNSEIENFGHVQIPIGDVGRCRVGTFGSETFAQPTAGGYCQTAASTNVPDGRPELILAAHRADYPVGNPDPSMFDVGVVFLIDGATRSILQTYYHPEPQPSAAFGFSLHNPFAAGDLGFGNAADNADFPASAFRQNVDNISGAGRMYMMNGNIKSGPNTYSFGQLNDPTPTIGSNFGTAWSAVGDLVPAERKNELIIGGFASQPSRDLAVTDLWIFNAFYEKPLQQIQDPDQQPNSKFGSRVVPLGDLNEDGFLDFVAAADGWDSPIGAADNNQGRMYIFRSDNTPAAVPPPPPPPAVVPPPPPAVVPPPPPAATRNGRRVSLRARPTRTRARRNVRLSGSVTETVAGSGCKASQTVSIQRSTSRTGTYKTLKSVKSSSTGAFSLTTKPTRTYWYRARVATTSKCLTAVSTRVRVQVRR
jgi:hypothetical protein